MKTPFITIPLKGMVDTDWIHPLKSYITSIYGPGDHFNEDIHAFHRLRQDVRGSAADSIGRDLIYKYYRQLDLLELRVPVNDRECRVAFTWLDAFTHESITQHSLAFEKASLLFNFATVCGRIGSDSDDIKVSYNAFQSAAGAYSFIMENFLHAPSTDLSQESVRALSKLMLAQAQEVFLTKLITEKNSKPAMVAKIAKGASNMYKSAGEALQTVHTQKSWGERGWFQYCFVKSKYFAAMSADYQSQSSEAGAKYGDAVAYSTLCLNSLQECARMTIPSNHSAITPILKAYLETCKQRLTALEKDNDFIYHSLVPSLATLPDLPQLEAAKPMAVRDMYKDRDVSQIVGREIFEKLIPMEVHEKSSLYSEQKANLLRQEGEKIEVADEELSSALEFLDLPGSLRLVKQSDDPSAQFEAMDVPADVNRWASEIQSAGGLRSVDFESVESMRSRIFRKIKSAEQQLEEEQKEHMDMKNKYGSQWSQSSPLTLSSGIMNDLSKAKGDLQSGAESDQKLSRMIEKEYKDISLLANGPSSSGLESAFSSLNGSQPESQSSLLDLDTTGDEDVKKWIDQTEEHLTRLSKISKERKTVFLEFKEKVHKDDISSLLVLNAKMPDVEEQLFKTELEKFQPYINRLDASIHRQKQELQDLSATWKKVLSNESVRKNTRSREGVRAQRDALTQRLRGAYDAWKASSDGVARGKEYYSNVESFTDSIVSNVDELLRNRREERRGLVMALESSAQDNLRNQLSGLSLSSDRSGSVGSGNAAWGDLSSLDKPSLPPKPPKDPFYEKQQPPLPPSSQFQQPQYQQPQYHQAPPPLQPSQAQYSQSFASQSQPQAPQPTRPPQAPFGEYGQPTFGVPSAYDPSMYAPEGNQGSQGQGANQGQQNHPQHPLYQPGYSFQRPNY